MSNKTCQCEFCKYHEIFKGKIKSLSEEDRDFFNALLDSYIELHEENEFNISVLNGTYPDADKLIARQRSK